MCRQVSCRTCGKPTWAGCGEHSTEVMRGIPQTQQCPGHANDPREPGFFARLFGGKN